MLHVELFYSHIGWSPQEVGKMKEIVQKAGLHTEKLMVNEVGDCLSYSVLQLTVFQNKPLNFKIV